jgi:hypothetical protein
MLTGHRCIATGHHDCLWIAIEPRLQADRIVRVQDGLSAISDGPPANAFRG